MVYFNELKCLKTNPFEGDFGSPGDKEFRDQIVTAKYPHACCLCLGKIKHQERNRVLVALFDGKLRQYRWCDKCCKAMSLEDKGRAWEKRELLRRKRIKLGNHVIPD